MSFVYNHYPEYSNNPHEILGLLYEVALRLEKAQRDFAI